MIQTQASQLERITENISVNNDTIEKFLSNIPKTKKILAKIFIIQEGYEQELESSLEWAQHFSSNNSCIWDQAALIDTKLLLQTHKNLKFQVPQRIKIDESYINIMPKQNNYKEIIKASQGIKFQFLQQFVHNIKKYDELLITLNSKEISAHSSLLSSIDLIYLLVPSIEKATVNAYETIKSLRKRGFISPIILVSKSLESGFNSETNIKRIKKAAKKFLGLDLIEETMVPSSNVKNTNMDIYNSSKELSALSNYRAGDFLQILSENIVYSIPGSI